MIWFKELLFTSRGMTGPRTSEARSGKIKTPAPTGYESGSPGTTVRRTSSYPSWKRWLVPTWISSPKVNRFCSRGVIGPRIPGDEWGNNWIRDETRRFRTQCTIKFWSLFTLFVFFYECRRKPLFGMASGNTFQIKQFFFSMHASHKIGGYLFEAVVGALFFLFVLLLLAVTSLDSIRECLIVNLSFFKFHT